MIPERGRHRTRDICSAEDGPAEAFAGIPGDGERWPKLLFIAGMMRSGTTLVAKALGGHQEIFAAGELANLWLWAGINGRCSCGDRILVCDVWGAVVQEVLARTGLSVEQLDHLQSRHRRLSSEVRPRGAATVNGLSYGDVLATTLRAVGAVTGKSVVVDTSKNLRSLLGHDSALDVVFLHLVRDPRGVAMSEAHHTAWPGVAVYDQPPIRSVARSAITWNLFNLVCEAALGGVEPERRSRVRYEDLVARPEQVLDGLVELAGLSSWPWQTRNDELWLQRGHIMNGNPMRHYAGWTRVRNEEAWRNGLSPGERRTVELYTALLRRRYGYGR